MRWGKQLSSVDCDDNKKPVQNNKSIFHTQIKQWCTCEKGVTLEDLYWFSSRWYCSSKKRDNLWKKSPGIWKYFRYRWNKTFSYNNTYQKAQKPLSNSWQMNYHWFYHWGSFCLNVCIFLWAASMSLLLRHPLLWITNKIYLGLWCQWPKQLACFGWRAINQFQRSQLQTESHFNAR